MITGSDLIAALGIPLASAADQAWADECAAGVTAYVDALPHVTPADWDPRTRVGAILLAKVTYNQRSAGDGIPTLDLTGSLNKPETAREIHRYLRIGWAAMPRVG